MVSSKTLTGTPHYMAPEVIYGQLYSTKADYWSLGVLLYEMVSGVVPFAEGLHDPFEIYQVIVEASREREVQFQPIFNKQNHTHIKNLLKSLLEGKPKLRAKKGIKGIKNDDFYIDIDWEDYSEKEIIPPTQEWPNLVKEEDSLKVHLAHWSSRQLLIEKNESSLNSVQKGVFNIMDGAIKQLDVKNNGTGENKEEGSSEENEQEGDDDDGIDGSEDFIEEGTKWEIKEWEELFLQDLGNSNENRGRKFSKR